jgi:hypothetical protein
MLLGLQQQLVVIVYPQTTVNFIAVSADLIGQKGDLGKCNGSICVSED